MNDTANKDTGRGWRALLHEIIFEADTPAGKAFNIVLIMILGYAIIAVPTGIVTVELSHAYGKQLTTQSCPECGTEGHDADAKHCKYCGAKL